ncbi:hypothetical protein QYF61_004108 [Mycteria americana]|uniref:Uncharacterized protein n=1 Tax=Mycteria americana TaxID=33587 RepID=A0AAN7N1U8_MYCAM|nr:hypothetical protein QYF61_004108 [Mycteria americana]
MAGRGRQFPSQAWCAAFEFSLLDFPASNKGNGEVWETFAFQKCTEKLASKVPKSKTEISFKVIRGRGLQHLDGTVQVYLATLQDQAEIPACLISAVFPTPPCSEKLNEINHTLTANLGCTGVLQPQLNPLPPASTQLQVSRSLGAVWRRGSVLLVVN